MNEKKQAELQALIASLQIIEEKAFANAVTAAQQTGKPLSTVLVEKDLIDPVAMGKILADFYGMKFIELAKIAIPHEVLELLPESVAQAKQAIAFFQDEKELHLAIVSPENMQLAGFLERKTGLKVVVFLASLQDIRNALALYQNSVQDSFSEMMSKQLGTASGKQATDPPIVEIVNSIIEHAYRNHASDVHIEPNEDTALVRFRIDGILHDTLTIPHAIFEQVVTRLKVMADLRTDEQQAAQDGKISFSLKEEELDIRISLVPITGGENVVMRLLSESSRQFSLISLGLSDRDRALVESAYAKPHGMILVTGPTGSGKTTSMYAVLKLLNKPSVNIMTIEDPVEYAIERVQQIQVNAKTNLTFATGLRSIVRQDPDIILVGEIRDEETASIAVNAAMTGHLLLSTLHTNDAATAIPRLIDMGVEPYLLASTINVIIAQRLVRKICQSCRVSREPNAAEQEFLTEHSNKKSTMQKLYVGKGCSVCHNTGYQGRVAIFEVLLLNDQIRAAIVEKRDSGIIHALALKNGMTSLFQDGIAKVEQGMTTIEEVLRVTKE